MSNENPTVKRIDPAAPAAVTRVAAYCRVSTGLESQQTSLEGQLAHWQQVISGHPDWKLIGMYSEAGASATHMETRPELLRLLSDCAAHKLEIFLATWIQSHDSFESEPPFEYPLNPLFSIRYHHRKRSEPLVCVSSPECFLY